MSKEVIGKVSKSFSLKKANAHKIEQIAYNDKQNKGVFISESSVVDKMVEDFEDASC